MTSGIDIAVVGAGPAGLYSAEELSARRADVRVDVLDRMPVPFGLVGYGIAPDHVRTKRVAHLLRRTLERPNVRFLGGVEVGRDVPFEDLARCYDGVVLATGAPRSTRLGLPGEDLAGSVAAVDFMAWANAHPDAVAPPLDSRAAVIVGAGNVALDVARLLLARCLPDWWARRGATGVVATNRGCVATRVHWSRGWAETTGQRRRLALAETMAHLRHLEAVGRLRPLADLPARWGACETSEKG